MEELQQAGWKQAEPKKSSDITEEDLRTIFNLVDIDRSGAVTKRVSTRKYQCQKCKSIRIRRARLHAMTTLFTRRPAWPANSCKNASELRM